jgi:hypothetical protein
MRQRGWLLGFSAALFLGGAVIAAELVHVKVREATVRTGPKPFKPSVATVRYGERVEVLDEKDDWLQIRIPGGVTGYLHKSAVTDEPLPALPPGPPPGGPPGSVSRDEVALAGKGFNPQVEAKYREQNPNREEMFRLVDAMERRDVPAEEIERFMRDGRLGEYGGRP